MAELVDNALDHCEEAGILPSISVVVDAESITVTDNGLGMPANVIRRMPDFGTRTSSRLNRATPSRGQQGNAGKCLIAAPYVINGDRGVIEITANAACHRIITTVDPIARIPVVEHVVESAKVQIGTKVKIDLPCKQGEVGVGRIESLLGEYAAFNKHAEFNLVLFGAEHCWSRSSKTIDKWTAKNPDPVHWYSRQAFDNLIAASIHADRESGRSRTVREFVRQFAGLKRSDTLGMVLEATGLARCDLSSLATSSGLDSRKVATLRSTMREVSEAPKPEKLGRIGRAHIERSLGGPVKYKCIQIPATVVDNLPACIEVAFRERCDDDGNRLFTGVNFSVDVRHPAIKCINELLAEFMVDAESPTDVLVHLTTPQVKYTNRGKTEVDTCPVIDSAVEDALQSVTKAFTAKMKAAERSANRPTKHQPQQKATIKDAIFAVMQESIDAVSQGGTCDFAARTHYYAVRPLVQKYTDADLSQSYLDAMIDDWEAIHGIIDRRTRDPRGFLLEPHTGRQIPLGTRQVDSYAVPLHLYHTIIYVEKKGLLSNFQFGRIAEKYDAAIICAEGFAVRAAQSLMQTAANGHEIKIFVFHDADPAGYSIANAIGENSGAHRFNFKIIDAGLRLDEAVEMGLPTETFTRKKALSKNLVLTPNERRLFEGTPGKYVGKNGKPRNRWTGCQRVELNALAANPSLFVDWVESKLLWGGAEKKLIPAEDVVNQVIGERYGERRRQAIHDAVMNALDIPAIVKSIDQRLPQPDMQGIYARLLEWGTKLEPSPWRSVCDHEVKALLNPLLGRIDQAAQEARQ